MRSEPGAGPDQDGVGQLDQQHDQLLSGQQMVADHCQSQAVLIALEIGFHAGTAIIVLEHAAHREIRPTGEDHGVIIATFVRLGRRAHRLLGQGTDKCHRLRHLGHLSARTGGGLPGAHPLHPFAHPPGGSDRAGDLLATLQQPGEARLTAPAAVQAHLGACAFLPGSGVRALPAEPTLHGVDRCWQDGETLHHATRADRFPHALLRVGDSYPYQFASRCGTGASHGATRSAFSLLAGREGRQIHVQDQAVSGEIVLPTVTVQAKQLAKRHLNVGHILLAGRIQRVRNGGLFGASRQPTGADQRRIEPDCRLCRADGFGSGQHGHQEHLQLWHRRLGEHVLLDVHMGFQWLEQADPAKLDA